MQKEQLKENSNYQLKRPLKALVHDIKNPIGAIAGFTELLEETQLDEEQRELVALIKRACNNACMVLDREITDSSHS
jgi:nitrogen-specific signal transduction histidine kinase